MPLDVTKKKLRCKNCASFWCFWTQACTSSQVLDQRLLSPLLRFTRKWKTESTALLSHLTSRRSLLSSCRYWEALTVFAFLLHKPTNKTQGLIPRCFSSDHPSIRHCEDLQKKRQVEEKRRKKTPRAAKTTTAVGRGRASCWCWLPPLVHAWGTLWLLLADSRHTSKICLCAAAGRGGEGGQRKGMGVIWKGWRGGVW